MTSNTPSNPPSSRPMTLRQQVNKLYTEYWHSDIGGQEFQEKMVELCQEIAREARSDWTLELPDLPWFQIKAFNEERAEWWSPIYDTTNLPVELTQKPPQPQGADSHTDIGDTVSGNEADNPVVLPPDSIHPPQSPNPSPSRGLNKIRRTHE